MDPLLPNFFLVGAAKAGTTSLHHYLGQHPSVFMSPIKEPHFFADEVRPENFCPEMRAKIEARAEATAAYLRSDVREPFSGGPIPNRDDYLRLFRRARPGQAIGEASPCYLWSPTAPANIAASVPNARILMILRHPVERAFAQYAHMLMFAASPISFREYVDAAIASKSTQISELYPFLNFGLYAKQVARYLELFPRKDIGIFFHEDLVREPEAVLRGMFRTLGADESFVPDFSERSMQAKVPRWWGLNRALKSSGLWELGRHVAPALKGPVRRAVFRERQGMKMSAADREFLTGFYRDDVRELERLLNRDLSHWLR